MNILHVTYTDLHGRRFNGYDLLDGLVSRGLRGRQAVLFKTSSDPRVFSLMTEPGDVLLHQAIEAAEQRHCMDNLLYPWGRLLAQSEAFKQADVVHYHLIHNGVVSVLDLKWLFDLKPSVWTLHDAWPLTGHCIHPRHCERWVDGCESCPAPAAIRALSRDCADRMWTVKRQAYSGMNVDLVVASDYMANMVSQSPLLKHLGERTHLIPFGIDVDAFLPDSAQLRCRKELAIPGDDFVVLFRATESGLKGLPYILSCFSDAPVRRTTLVTVDQMGLVEGLRSDYNIVELGWVQDPSRYAKVLSACDVLLMPSPAESFGLMALESIAAGRPVVCFQGTAMESLLRDPACGTAVSYGDAAALKKALDDLALNSQGAVTRGERCRHVARSEYSMDQYLDRLAELYQDARGCFHGQVDRSRASDKAGNP